MRVAFKEDFVVLWPINKRINYAGFVSSVAHTTTYNIIRTACLKYAYREQIIHSLILKINDRDCCSICNDRYKVNTYVN
ncbi:hypothetical protein SAMN05660841_00447 [Sphingobacterium nematocida]|uniref:Uncharacterized protein n=1 Tax=Sphingobacterium nematocida TaxID=1513896 RepID=A0A1T5B3X2_9SPHI|nr:hypothetical protein SAMN05660841_00447 [Sphingobacterium nematocida]